MPNSPSLAALAVAVLLFSSACASGGAATHKVPPAACPDDLVAAELATLPREGFENTWAWLDAVYVMLDQITLARGDEPC